jgi:hypothetical protein
VEDVALTVIACYRPHSGKEKQLAELVREHQPVLRAEGLVSDDAVILLQSGDGTVLEIFSQLPRQLADLAEAGQPFAHFRRVSVEEL